MKFNSHPPPRVLIKAATITAGRRAGLASTARLCSAVWAHTVPRAEGTGRRVGDGEKGEYGVNKAAEDCGGRQRGARGA